MLAVRNEREKTMALDYEENMCFAGFVFACFVFASVFISDEGEPSRMCQAPVSMQAIISVSFEVHVCVCLSVYVCVHCGVWVCSVAALKYTHIAFE